MSSSLPAVPSRAACACVLSSGAVDGALAWPSSPAAVLTGALEAPCALTLGLAAPAAELAGACGAVRGLPELSVAELSVARGLLVLACASWDAKALTGTCTKGWKTTPGLPGLPGLSVALWGLCCPAKGLAGMRLAAGEPAALRVALAGLLGEAAPGRLAGVRTAAGELPRLSVAEPGLLGTAKGLPGMACPTNALAGA